MSGCSIAAFLDLSHIYYSGKMYNGVAASEISAAGSARNGIDKVHDEFIGRGVLLDMARHASTTCWDLKQPIRSEDLDACADAQGITIEPGDILIVRTGAMTAVNGDDWSGFARTCLSGLHFTMVRWLAEHQVAAVAADNVMVEGPSPVAGVTSPTGTCIQGLVRHHRRSSPSGGPALVPRRTQ